MPVPQSYTEEQLATFMEKTLGDTAAILGLSTSSPSPPGDYEEAIISTLLDLGVADIAEVPATQIGTLRALARVRLWEFVAATTAGDYTFSADGASYNRDQINDHALAMLKEARAEAMRVDPAYAAVVERVSYHRDPYADYSGALADRLDALRVAREALL